MKLSHSSLISGGWKLDASEYGYYWHLVAASKVSGVNRQEAFDVLYNIGLGRVFGLVERGATAARADAARREQAKRGKEES